MVCIRWVQTSKISRYSAMVRPRSSFRSWPEQKTGPVEARMMARVEESRPASFSSEISSRIRPSDSALRRSGRSITILQIGPSCEVISRLVYEGRLTSGIREASLFYMRFLRMLAISGAFGLMLAQPSDPSTTLKVGDTPPDFTLPSTQGGTAHLDDYVGKSTVVLAFFPAAFTGG